MGLINEKRFFSEVLPHIGNKNKIVEELVENAKRANASEVSIKIYGNSLSIHNDGDDIDDWLSLFCVADSGYEPTVLAQQNPAGMGLLMVMSVAKSMIVHNRDIKLTIDCPRFFSEKEYRDLIHRDLLSIKRYSGHRFMSGVFMSFKLERDLIKLFERFYACKCPSELYNLKHYGMIIHVNGRTHDPKDIQYWASVDGSDAFSNAKIGIPRDRYNEGVVFWHGKRIVCREIEPFCIEVTGEFGAFKPQLPDRERIDGSVGFLTDLKGSLEDQLSDSIQNMLNDVCAPTLETRDDSAPCISMSIDMLHTFKNKYCIDHFQTWVDGNNKSFDANGFELLFGADAIIEGNSFETLYRIESKTTKPIVFNVPLKIGSTPAPKWVRDASCDRMQFSFKYHSLDGCIHGQSYDYHYIDEVSLNGIGVDIVAQLDGTCFSNVYLIQKCIDDLCFNYDCGYDTIDTDVCLIRSQIDGLNLYDLLNTLRSRSGLDDISSFVFDAKSKKIEVRDSIGNSASVEVKC